jgi:hypothetical protein
MLMVDFEELVYSYHMDYDDSFLNVMDMGNHAEK